MFKYFYPVHFFLFLFVVVVVESLVFINPTKGSTTPEYRSLLCFFVLNKGNIEMSNCENGKVAVSNPCWSGGIIFFSRVDFLC